MSTKKVAKTCMPKYFSCPVKEPISIMNKLDTFAFVNHNIELLMSQSFIDTNTAMLIKYLIKSLNQCTLTYFEPEPHSPAL